MKETDIMSHKGHFILPYFKSMQNRAMHEKQQRGNKQEMNFKLEHKNYIQANSNIRTGGKKIFYLLI